MCEAQRWNQSRWTSSFRAVVLASVHCLLALAMIGCAQQRGVPKEVIFNSDRGSWSVGMDRDATEVPEYVPVVTIHKGERVDGLLLVEGTPGYRAVMPKVISPRRQSGTILKMPYAVRQAWYGSWTLRWDSTMHSLVTTGDLLDHINRPIQASFPVRLEMGPSPNRVRMAIPVSPAGLNL